MKDKIQISDETIKASREVYHLLFSKLNSQTGIHVGTFVSAAVRLAGTCLFRSFNFKPIDAKPGACVLSEEADVEVPQLVNLLVSILKSYKVEIKSNPDLKTPAERLPKLDIVQMQTIFQEEFFGIMKDHHLNLDDSAVAGVVTAAGIIHQTRKNVALPISTGVAMMGFIEGLKTLPVPLK